MLSKIINAAKCFWLGVGCIVFFGGSILFVWLGLSLIYTNVFGVQGKDNAIGYAALTLIVIVVASCIGGAICDGEKEKAKKCSTK